MRIIHNYIHNTMSCPVQMACGKSSPTFTGPEQPSVEMVYGQNSSFITAELAPSWLGCGNATSMSVTAPKLAVFLVSVMAVIVKHGFCLLSVTAETTLRFWREPKLSLLSIRQLHHVCAAMPACR